MEDNKELRNIKIKKAILAGAVAVLSGAIGLGVANCAQKKDDTKQNDNEQSSLTETVVIVAEPIQIVRDGKVEFVAPTGYTLGDDGKCYKVQYNEGNLFDPFEIYNEDGEIIYGMRVIGNGDVYYSPTQNEYGDRYEIIPYPLTKDQIDGNVECFAPEGYQIAFDAYGNMYCYKCQINHKYTNRK